MKQTIKLWMFLMLVLPGIMSCVNISDNPVPSATEDKAFSNDQYIDQAVRPGDNFYRYAYGKWLDDSTALDVPTIVSRKLAAMEAKVLNNQDDPVISAVRQRVEAIENDDTRDFELLKSRIEYLESVKTQDELLAAFTQMHKWGYQPLARQMFFGDEGVIQPVLISAPPTPTAQLVYAMGNEEMVDKLVAATCKDITSFGYGNERIEEIVNNATVIEKLELAAYESVFNMVKRNIDNPRPTRRSASIPTAFNEVCRLIGVGEFADKLLTDILSQSQTDALKRACETLLAGTDESIAQIRDYMIYYLFGQDFIFIPRFRQNINSADRLNLAMKNVKYYMYRQQVEAYGKENIYKEKCLEMMEDFRQILIERISKLDWMSDATKQEAQNKARKMIFNIGYPDQWNDEFTPVVEGETLLETVGNLRLQTAEYARKIVGRSVKTNGMDFWCSLLPFSLYNAMYDPGNNQLVILPAFLTAPTFDIEQSEATLYGTAFVFGHEMCHGFDAGGSKHDETGALRDWWTPEDKAAFEQKQQQLIDLWGQLEHYPGQPADGEFTLKENMADYGGVTLALEAYKRRLLNQGFYGKEFHEQVKKFFLSYGVSVALEGRERSIEQLKASYTNDVHSAGHNRVNGICRLMDDWYRLFDVRSADKLFVKPEDRVRIW